ncbi:hypothetical protein BV22DRAFT_920425 [Leucogyrophana mollusca]|uniref:Uncharacterized protein n=1 Tax=Leucogyrophana mollusca TaxID=85980 RepID=A0ACB8AZL9_9AGAM|nr:hypothetical protein BV22DRAFT_920425 [Leucogyrophana mollusca]
MCLLTLGAGAVAGSIRPRSRLKKVPRIPAHAQINLRPFRAATAARSSYSHCQAVISQNTERGTHPCTREILGDHVLRLLLVDKHNNRRGIHPACRGDLALCVEDPLHTDGSDEDRRGVCDAEGRPTLLAARRRPLHSTSPPRTVPQPSSPSSSVWRIPPSLNSSEAAQSFSAKLAATYTAQAPKHSNLSRR